MDRETILKDLTDVVCGRLFGYRMTVGYKDIVSDKATTVFVSVVVLDDWGTRKVDDRTFAYKIETRRKLLDNDSPERHVTGLWAVGRLDDVTNHVFCKLKKPKRVARKRTR